MPKTATMRYTVIRQHDATDCGPAALATVAAYHRTRVSLASLREAALTDRHGTTVAGIVAAAACAGLSASAVRAGADALQKIQTPAIAHWRENERNHFVVVFKIGPTNVDIGDPARGLRRMTADEFHRFWTGVLILLVPVPSLHLLYGGPAPLVRLCRFLAPYRRSFLVAFFAAVLMTILSLTSSFFIQALVDSVFVHGRTAILYWLTLGMLAALLARTVFQGLRSFLLARLSMRIDADVMMGLHRHLLGLPLSFFQRRKTGEVLSRFNDALKIRVAISSAALSVLVDGLLVAATAAVMLALDWRLAIAALGLLPLLGVATWILHTPLKDSQLTAMEKGADLEAHLLETVAAMQTIKSFRGEELTRVRTEARLDQVLRAAYRTQTLSIASGLCTSLAAGVSTVALLSYGGSRVLDNSLTVGQLMAFYSLLGMILVPLERLSTANQAITDAVVASARIGEILELETETSRASAMDRTLSGDIAFQAVTYRYGFRPPVFENITFEIRAGECVGIGGRSGCGKTTLVNLLGRFLEPGAGRVLIDGVDVRDYTLPCLRREIAYLHQDIALLHGSLADNIRLGKPHAAPSEIRAAASLAGVDEFAARLPHGYDTIVGERGICLSGGERQRVAGARAILADAPILVMDEPVSHLDSISARAVQDLMDSRRGKATTIVISHRPLRVDRTIHLSG